MAEVLSRDTFKAGLVSEGAVTVPDPVSGTDAVNKSWAVANIGGPGPGHNMPYGVYSTDVSELGIASTAASYSIPFGVDVESAGIAHSTTVDPHLITVPSDGLYHVVVSAQVTITASPVRKKMFVWLAINGTDVSDATLTTEITNIDQIVPMEALYVMSLQADDTVEFRYAAEDPVVKFISVAATGTPPKPAAPCVVVTVNKFSPISGVDPLATVPAGGAAGQVLKKNSNTDYDAGWAAIPTITVGSTPPATPAVNDIWVDTN